MPTPFEAAVAAARRAGVAGPLSAAHRAFVTALLCEHPAAIDAILGPLLAGKPAEALVAPLAEARLLQDRAGIRFLVAQGVVPAAVAQLGAPATRAQALRALHVLAAEHAAAVGDAGGVAALLPLLPDAAAALDALAVEPANQERVLRDPHELVRTLELGDAPEGALGVLRKCLQGRRLPAPDDLCRAGLRALGRRLAGSLGEERGLCAHLDALRLLVPHDPPAVTNVLFGCVRRWPARLAAHVHALRTLCAVAQLGAACADAVADGAPYVVAALASEPLRAAALAALPPLARRERGARAVARNADALRAVAEALHTGAVARRHALEALAPLLRRADARRALAAACPLFGDDAAAAFAADGGDDALDVLAHAPAAPMAGPTLLACVPRLLAACGRPEARAAAAAVLDRCAPAVAEAVAREGVAALLAALPDDGVSRALARLAEHDACADALAAADPAHAWAGGDADVVDRLCARQAEARAEARAAAHEARVAAYRARGADLDAPDGGTCPLTLETMRDPVVAADGNTYERAAIAAVLAGDDPRSPLTRAPLAHGVLVPNNELRRRVRAHEEAAMAAYDAARAAEAPPKRARRYAPKAFSSA
jgi:hypothetical protein